MGSALYFKNQNKNIIDLKILNSYRVDKDFIENKKKNENNHNDYQKDLSKFPNKAYIASSSPPDSNSCISSVLSYL